MENLGLFDTHCHLFQPDLKRELPKVLRRASRAGVTDFMVPGISLETSIAAAEMGRCNSNIIAAAGVHPNDKAAADPEVLKRIWGILPEPGVHAVGETGMDLYRDTVPREVQLEALAAHAEMAAAFGMTLILHSRGAEKDVLKALDPDLPVPVVMHCYTGSAGTGLEAAERGYYIGFAGPLTYRANSELRKLAGEVPLQRILLETDSPYLSPEPVRGGINEPSRLVYILETLSEVLQMDQEHLSRILRSNSQRAFQLNSTRRTDLVYRLGDNIYLNITGRCNNRCRFCIRDRADGIGGYYLRHREDPDGDRLRTILRNLPVPESGELVFCGYGEPTLRPGLLQDLVELASARGFRCRLNTNGLCLLHMSREQVTALASALDVISVSLNASSDEEYRRICRPSDENAWIRLMEFIKLVRNLSELRTTAVRYPGINLKASEELAADLGLPFRVRG